MMKREQRLVGVVAAFIVCAGREGAAQEAPGDIVAMEEVVITASRMETRLRDTPDIVQVIGRAEIEQLQPASTGELLHYATGVSGSTGTGSGLPKRTVVSVNGLPPQYTLALVDGVPLLTDHIHTGQNLDLIPPHAIERIEIMRGAASAQYGRDAIGGIVNIVTRKCTGEPEATIRASAGRYDTYEGGVRLLVPAGRPARISSSLNWEESDGLKIKAPAHRVGKMGYERLSALNRVDWDLAETTKVATWMNWVNTRMDWLETISESDLVAPGVEIAHQWSPKLDLRGKVSYTEWNAELNNERNVLLKPEAYASWKLGERQTLMAGADYGWSEFERTAVSSREQQAHGLFLQHEWSNPGKLGLMSALRYDKVEDVEAAWSPKVSALVFLEEHARLRASVGRGFHAPTLQERYEEGYGHGGRAYRFGNPDLDPEYSTTYTLGLEVEPADPVQLVFYGYYSDLDDMIVPVYEGPWAKDPTLDVWRRQNIKNAEVYGGEAEAKIRLGEHLRLEAGYTYTANEDKDTGRKLPYSPGSSLFGKLVASYPFPKNRVLGGYVGVRAAFDREAWNWKPAPETPPDNPHGLTTPLKDYTQVDAGLTFTAGPAWEAFVKVQNIFGEDIENLDDAYTVIDGEPVVQVGVKYNLPVSK